MGPGQRTGQGDEKENNVTCHRRSEPFTIRREESYPKEKEGRRERRKNTKMRESIAQRWWERMQAALTVWQKVVEWKEADKGSQSGSKRRQ